MNPETQTSVEEHADQIIEATRETNSEPLADVLEFPDRRSQVEAAASRPGDSLIQSYKRSEEEARANHDNSGSRQPNRLRKLLAGTALVAAAAWLFNPFGGEDKPAKNDIKSYTELAQDSAKIPASPDEKILISVRVDESNPDKNSGSEAVLNDEAVKKYIEDNPDQHASIVSSANGLPTVSDGDMIGLVERHIDNDDNGDVVAVPLESENR